MHGFVLERPELVGRLDAAGRFALTTISAPAGYGKTVLLRQWVQQNGRATTWVDLHPACSGAEADDRLATALSAAIGVDPPGSTGCFSDDGRPTSALLEALAGAPEHVVIVDDQRDIDPDPGLAWLAAAIADVPDCGLRLVLATRRRPAPEVAALRLRDAAALLGPKELSLTLDQTSRLVEGITGRPVPQGVAEGLTEHYAGWMTGVALAARSWPTDDHPTLAQVVTAAAESVDAYLQTEVLAHLPVSVLAFVRQTAPLPLLSAELADRVAGAEDGVEAIEWLRARGAFLEPSDRGRGFFRLHPQLRESVRATQAGTVAEQEAVLRRAAAWYIEHDLVIDACACFADLRDWEELRKLVSIDGVQLFTSGRTEELLGVLRRVPSHVYRQELSWVLAVAVLRIADGQIAPALDLLATVQTLLEPGEAVRADAIRSIAVGWEEDTTPYIALADAGIAACDELPEDHTFPPPDEKSMVDHFRSTFRRAGLLAGALAGEWETAERFDHDIAPATRYGMHPAFECGLHSQRAVHRVLIGHAREALIEARAGLELAEQVGMLDHPVTVECHLALGEALRLSGRAAEARPALERGLVGSLTIHRHNGLLLALGGMCSLDIDLGLPAQALERLNEHRVEVERKAPWTLAAFLCATEARALVALRRHEEALAVLARCPGAAVTATVEVLAWLDLGNVREAQAVADGWPDEPTPGARLRRALVEVALLDAAGRSGEAGARLESTLALAEATEQVQPYVELGQVLVGPLRRFRIGQPDDALAPVIARVRRAVVHAAGPQTLPLTAQELVVLGQLARGHTLNTVAEAMFISINTVKTHVRSIYRKLGVTVREDAVRIWREHVAGDAPPT